MELENQRALLFTAAVYSGEAVSGGFRHTWRIGHVFGAHSHWPPINYKDADDVMVDAASCLWSMSSLEGWINTVCLSQPRLYPGTSLRFSCQERTTLVRRGIYGGALCTHYQHPRMDWRKALPGLRASPRPWQGGLGGSCCFSLGLRLGSLTC